MASFIKDAQLLGPPSEWSEKFPLFWIECERRSDGSAQVDLAGARALEVMDRDAPTTGVEDEDMLAGWVECQRQRGALETGQRKGADDPTQT